MDGRWMAKDEWTMKNERGRERHRDNGDRNCLQGPWGIV